MTRGIFEYAAHADPLTAASNKIALVLLGNTPFYPLYLAFCLGRPGWPWLLFSGVSLPFFAAALPIARRNGFSGRVWLSAVATLNSTYVTWLLGESSGTALFLIPCTALALMSFRRREWRAMVSLAALPGLLFLSLHNHFPAPPAIYSASAYHALQHLNEFSVISISVVLAYVFGKTRLAA
ncbi:hypothetical protein GCM10010909_16980 [Acidocella aquatica]|uniref:Apolipoprotein N-acyltransferase n=1 Tax=Acidocella aquatica TaxID=1922313 RepID=A0ABQ6A6X4_9PROT|nr:hypothetical protein [Acidocella aquatica]GLR67017.1 hypothetical protein GCM10010909_16980 [Acidocella aquatica]